MATLAAMAAGSRSMALGLGVAPLDERTPRDIVDELHRVALQPERVVLGVGSGGSSSLQLVRAGVASLRALLPDVRICVSALGPRMCRLGGEVADVVLLNWATPARIVWAHERIAEGDAQGRLATEAARYRRRPRSYGRLFAEQDADEIPGVAAETPVAVAALLAPYREVLDSCIVRALPVGDAPEDWLAVARAATLRA
jgi:alkanesulfonate monooxygenase SsuD/methylene tetrahydromethanopterin reductase-like flavin-dependent oxidoreductase (luciferase family)